MRTRVVAACRLLQLRQHQAAGTCKTLTLFLTSGARVRSPYTESPSFHDLRELAEVYDAFSWLSQAATRIVLF